MKHESALASGRDFRNDGGQKKKSIREEERILFLFLKDTDTPAVIDFYLTRARRFLHSRVIPEGAEMRRFTCFRDVGQHFLLLIFFSHLKGNFESRTGRALLQIIINSITREVVALELKGKKKMKKRRR